MNRIAGVFSLTRSEQRVVIILILALLSIALLTRSRETFTPKAQLISTPSVTPTPQEPD